MSNRLAVFLCAWCLATCVDATEKKDAGRYLATPLKGDYYVYAGTLAEMQPPTTKDRKISIMLGGTLAKDLFKQIGQDASHACSTAPGYHERRRGDLICIQDDDGYSCYIGLDVIRGKSISGVIC